MTKIIMMKKDVYENEYNKRKAELSKWMPVNLKARIALKYSLDDIPNSELVAFILKAEGWYSMIEVDN